MKSTDARVSPDDRVLLANSAIYADDEKTVLKKLMAGADVMGRLTYLGKSLIRTYNFLNLKVNNF